MITGYNLKKAESSISTPFTRFKQRLKVAYKALTGKGFVFITIKEKTAENVVDIINYSLDDKTTLNALKNYSSILVNKINFSNQVDKQLKEWLHTDN